MLAADTRDEVKPIAAAIIARQPIDVEYSLRIRLEYYESLKARMAGTPLHVAVDSFFAVHPTTTKVGVVIATAYVLLEAIRREDLADSKFARDQAGTIRRSVPSFCAIPGGFAASILAATLIAFFGSESSLPSNPPAPSMCRLRHHKNNGC